MKQKQSDQQDEKGRRRRARFWRFLQIFAVPILTKKYRYACDRIELKGPYLLIANHAANFDPILMGIASPEPLTVVGSEHLERLGFLTRLIHRFFSLIPRRKAASGRQTVIQILKALKQDQPVLLFAEGECTWDGVSAEIFPATGKLAKLARVPLVTFRLQGNYLAQPRWAKKARKGPISGRIVNVYSPEQLGEMNADDVNDAINRDLFVDAPSRAQLEGTKYRSRASAQGLEQALFICPACQRIGVLRAEGDELSCDCGMRARLDQSGVFAEGPFVTIHDWDAWQRQTLEELLGNDDAPTELFPGSGKLTDCSDGTTREVRFSLDLSAQAIRIDGEAHPFSGISDIAMVKASRLVFTADHTYYELFAKNAILRPYLMAVQASQKGTER